MSICVVVSVHAHMASGGPVGVSFSQGMPMRRDFCRRQAQFRLKFGSHLLRTLTILCQVKEVALYADDRSRVAEKVDDGAAATFRLAWPICSQHCGRRRNVNAFSRSPLWLTLIYWEDHISHNLPHNFEERKSCRRPRVKANRRQCRSPGDILKEPAASCPVIKLRAIRADLGLSAVQHPMHRTVTRRESTPRAELCSPV